MKDSSKPRSVLHKYTVPSMVALVVLVCGWALYARFGPKTTPASIAARAVDCLWAGDFDCMAPHITHPVNWEEKISRETMRRVYQDYFKPKLSRYKIISDGDRVQVNLSATAGGTGMFVIRPDGTEARFQFSADQWPGGLGYGIGQPFRQVWAMEFAPSGLSRKEAMNSTQMLETLVKGISQDKERLEELGLKGSYTLWGSFVTWDEQLAYATKMAVYQRWAFERDHLGKKHVPEPEFPYLPGDPERPTPGNG